MKTNYTLLFVIGGVAGCAISYASSILLEALGVEKEIAEWLGILFIIPGLGIIARMYFRRIDSQ